MKLLKYDRSLTVNEEVRQLQENLNEIKRKYATDWEILVVDGKFGRRTREVVKAFQTFICINFIDIAVDGIVGPQTRESIFYCLNTHMIPHKSVIQASFPPAESFNRPKTQPKKEQSKFDNGPSRTEKIITTTLDATSTELAVISETVKEVAQEGGRLAKVGKVLGPLGTVISIGSTAIDIEKSGEVKPYHVANIIGNIPGLSLGWFLLDKGYALSSEYIWGYKNPKTFSETLDTELRPSGWDLRFRDDSPNNEEKNNNQY